MKSFATLLTLRRIRMHGFILAVILWSVYATDLATPGKFDSFGLLKGTDFVQFYILGSLVHSGRADLLYDMHAQAEWLKQLMPRAKDIFYAPVYGPQVSLFFTPFAHFSYPRALAIWLVLSVAIYGISCWLIWRTCPQLRKFPGTSIILALAFPGFFHLITFGQNSGLALLCFTLAYLAFRNQYSFLAGLAIGMLVFKPQFVIVPALVFLFAREWIVVIGMVLSSVGQLAVGRFYFGAGVMQRYFRTLTENLNSQALIEPHLYQTFSFRGFWLLLVPANVGLILYLLSVVAVVVLAIRCWKSRASIGIRYSGLVLATILAAPHCNIYDLVILVPAFLLLGDWSLGKFDAEARMIKILLYSCYLLFLLTPLTKLIHLQLGVIALLCLFWTTWKIAKQQPAALREAHPAIHSEA
jgi:hypothetical protein